MSRYYGWMSHYTPVFRVRGDNVKILTTPTSFYETLKVEIRNAKKRIILSSLYLGTGKMEKSLVEDLHAAQAANPDLQVQILLDYSRGSRGKENSRTMLLPLKREFGSRFHLALYHTPQLRGFFKWVLPDKYNETFGVQHMKVYLFDDNLIISGANLSENYFTNRQDRYMLVSNSAALSNFCEKLVDSVASSSFQLQPDNTVATLPALKHHPYKGFDFGRAYKAELRQRIQSVLDPKNWSSNGTFSSATSCPPDDRSSTSTANAPARDSVYKNPYAPDNAKLTALARSAVGTEAAVGTEVEVEGGDTWIMPLVQMSQLGITQDDQVTQHLWKQASDGATVYLSSGYLNFPDHYQNILLRETKAEFHMLTAHPTANGFYGARGLPGAVPDTYTHVAKQFHDKICNGIQGHRLSIREYKRSGWTFHAKGLWYYQRGQSLPSMTYIGSPNFGYRSVYRDLEVQFGIVTENTQLQTQLDREHKNLYKLSTPVTDETFRQPERLVPRWIQVGSYFLRNFF